VTGCKRGSEGRFQGSALLSFITASVVLLAGLGVTALQSQTGYYTSPLVITTASTLPSGQVGAAYSQTLAATGGTPPYSWSISGLPAGLTLSPAGVLSGTPTASGGFTLAVKVTDSAGSAASASLSLTINASSGTSIGSIVNGYSVVGGTVAPGELVTIFGSNLSDGTASVTSTPVPTTLQGTQVLFDGVPVYLLYVSPSQVNVMAPFAIAGRNSTSVQVSRDGQTSLAVALSVATSAPGLETVSGSGQGQVVAYHDANNSLISATSPAVKGETVTIEFTGGGQTNPPETDTAQPPTASFLPLVQNTVVTIGGISAPVLYAGGVPGSLGVDQVNFSMPAGVPGGNAAVVVTVGSANSQSGVTIPVAGSVAATTSTTLTSSPNPSVYGQAVTLTATVSPSTATGTVTFKEGSATLGTSTLAGGQAVLVVSTLAVGTQLLTAAYGGDSNDAASLSTPVTQTVNPAATTTTLTSSANPSAYLQSVTLTATVSPATATGTVTFKDGSTTLRTSTLSGGKATLAYPFGAGTHSLTAVYGGDLNDAASTSAALTQTVNLIVTSTSLATSANPSASGLPLTLTASVAQSNANFPGGIIPVSLTATGTVTFMDGSSSLGSAALSNGTASLTLTTLSIGTHSLTAVYSGDTYDAPSTSSNVNEIINGISPVAPCSPIFSYTIGQNAPSPVVCQFTAITAASFSVTTTASWLQVGPSSGSLGPAPASFSISVNPAGLAAGPYSGSFTISGPQLGSATVTAQLNVAPGAASMLFVTPPSLSFNYEQNSQAPATQAITVSSANGIQAPFSVTANGGSWLVAGVNGGSTPEPFNVIVVPIGLAPNTYNGTLTISSPGVPPVTVNVTLTVTAPVPPQLNVDAPTLSLSALGGGSPVTAQGQVSNAGGGVLNFTATASGGNWLSVSPGSGVVDNTATSTTESSVSVTITADPTSLSPGTYEGSVTVAGGGATFTIPVTFSVASPAPVILLSQSGLTITAVAQAGAPLPQQVGILNVGSGALNWTATFVPVSGGNWLLLSSAGGTVQTPYLDVNLLTASIDPGVLGGLAAGNYYGQIQITDPTGQAVNSPQVVTVILTVLAPGSDPGPEIQPSGLIFTGQAGSSPPAQNVMIGIRKAATDQFITGTIGSGFKYTPSSSSLQPSQPVTMQVTPDFSAVNPGDIGRGTITLQFSDGTARNISLLTVVAPPQTGSARFGPRTSNNCSTLELQWRTPSTAIFNVVQGQGQTLQVQVVDACGNLIGPSNPKAASVNVAFSDHDPDLSLVHIGNGVWSGTWKPGVNLPSGPVTVVATAFNSTGQALQSGSSSPLTANVSATPFTPLVTAAGVQQAASYVKGQPIAPGTLITLQGLNLADASSNVSDLPYPTAWNGAQVFMGTEPLPLLFAASGQVNVQVPYDVPVNTQFQVTVQRDSYQSLPEQLVIAAAQPGIFTADATGSGQGEIFDAGTLAAPGSPAAAGDTITILCTGLGTVTPSVPAGTPPPDSPVSTTDNAVSVTIGGLDGQASFGTLVPGQPGVYQVTAVVPAGVSGPSVPVVVTVAGQSSPPQVTMAVQ
jgi:uncharacterized protein (TIGR03437 family)